MINSVVQNIFRLICTKDYQEYRNNVENSLREDYNFEEAEDFLNHFGKQVDIRQKTILDIGCGYGGPCVYLGLQGAARVVGIDIDEKRINYAKSKLAKDYPGLTNIVDFMLPADLKGEKFDFVISKDSFEHYADPENFMLDMKKYLKQGSKIVLRFGPLWKSPTGGHISYMTKFPWAHLLFPESIIMDERKRCRPNENAMTFEQYGLNKMTFKRYLNILKINGYEIEYLKINVPARKSKRRLLVLFNVFRKIPFADEFFTQNVYSIML